MASGSERPQSTTGRKVRRLAVGVAIVIALYTGGWFYAAGRLETFLKESLAAAPAGLHVSCNNLSVGGFPFLIGVTCSDAAVQDGRQDIALETGPLRSAARIYMPGQAMFELDAPMRARIGEDVELEGDWSLMHASAAAGLDGLKRSSLEGKDIDLKLNLPTEGTSFDIGAGLGQVHVRDNAGDLDIALLAEKLDWKQIGFPQSLPTLSASLDMTLVGKGSALQSGQWGTKEGKGELRAFKVDMGNGIYGELSGPFTIDAEGWVSGTLNLTLERLDLWDKTLAEAFPDAAGTISGMAQMIKSLSNGKTDRVSVKLTVIRGTITLSLLPIGHIPQL